MGRGEDDGEYSGEQSTATLLPGGASASPEPSSVVFSPPLVLTLFSAMAFFIYLDRGAVASNGINGSPRTPDNPTGSGIQGEFDLTLMQAGLLPAAFMIGLLVASPIYAEASKHVNGLRLMATGLFLWCLAVWGCSLSWDFVSLLLCRALVVGRRGFLRRPRSALYRRPRPARPPHALVGDLLPPDPRRSRGWIRLWWPRGHDLRLAIRIRPLSLPHGAIFTLLRRGPAHPYEGTRGHRSATNTSTNPNPN